MPFDPLSPSGTLCIARFNIQQFYVLPTQCIYVFCVDLTTNSDYFTVQHYLTGLCNCDGVCLLRGTDCIYVFCVDLRTNSDYFTVQH
jgi:hypothetical protein